MTAAVASWRPQRKPQQRHGRMRSGGTLSPRAAPCKPSRVRHASHSPSLESHPYIFCREFNPCVPEPFLAKSLRSYFVNVISCLKSLKSIFSRFSSSAKLICLSLFSCLTHCASSQHISWRRHREGLGPASLVCSRHVWSSRCPLVGRYPSSTVYALPWATSDLLTGAPWRGLGGGGGRMKSNCLLRPVLCFVTWSFLFKIEFILLFYLVPSPAGRIKEFDKMPSKGRNRIELGAILSFLLSEQNRKWDPFGWN